MSPHKDRSDRSIQPGRIEGWPDAEYDAVLQLLDRQIVDVDGMSVGKVDDLELAEDPDGTLVPTGLLVGMAALLPRFGDRIYRWWVQLAPAQAERSRPGVVDLDLVDDVTSEVHLSVGRDGLLHPRTDMETSHPVRRTLGQILSMAVDLPPDAGGRKRGRTRVLDVRLGGERGDGIARVTALIVGHGRPGSMLGYERSGERGPWPVAALVSRIHRHSRLVSLGPDVDLDWEARRVRVGPGADVRPLSE